MGRTSRRGALVLAVMTAAWLAAAGSPSAQTFAPGPTLQLTEAKVRQNVDDLRFGLRFNAAVPAAQLQAQAGRVVCVVISPGAATRRSLCVSRRSGRLVATLGVVDAAFRRSGSSRRVRSASIHVDGDFLSLRAPARSLKIGLGKTMTWLALLRFNDGGPCAPSLAANPDACTQRLPAAGELSFKTKSSRLPLFARQGRLRLLATGDSMIQYVDTHLERRLERRRKTSVRSDAHVGTGISDPSDLNWVKQARRHASGRKPNVTVMFIGANDGYNMGSAACCNAAWVTEYARRVESMMRSYRRQGRSIVYWLTLPAPQSAAFAKIFTPVNEAIRRAGKRFESGVRVIDTAKVFTPGNVFRKRMRFRGRTVTVRQSDGIHLTLQGAAIAATLIVDRLRADRLLPRLK